MMISILAISGSVRFPWCVLCYNDAASRQIRPNPFPD